MTALDFMHAANDFVVSLPMQIPDPDPIQPPGTEGVTVVLSWLKWIGYAIIGGAIIVGGILIGISFKRGEGHDALPKILWPMAGAIVIGAGVAMVSTIAGT